MKYTSIIIFLLLPGVLLGQIQFSPLKRALDNLQEGDADRASEILIRALERDSLDPGITYGLSVLYNSSSFPRSNLDSAYHFILQARAQYRQLEAKDIDKLNRTGIDSSLLERQKIQLDSQAFQLALKKNTVEAFRDFQSDYATSRQMEEAREREMEVAFDNTSAVDTYSAYEDYMETYPDSKYYDQALDRFERLLFLDKTRDRKLRSYLSFIEIRPESPYRTNAEREIFEVMSAGNRLKDYRQFFELARDPKLKKRAVNILFHVLKDRDELNELPPEWITDSLEAIMEKKDILMMPVVQNRRVQFINQHGEILNASFESTFDSFVCDPAISDITMGMEGDRVVIQTLQGQLIYSKTGEEATDLGSGLIRIKSSGKYGLIHKTGFDILPSIYDDILNISGGYVAAKVNGAWGLNTFTGKQVLPHEYDGVHSVGELVILSKGNKYAFTSINSLRQGADGKIPALVFIYDEYEQWSPEMVWAKAGKSEAIINHLGTFDIELAEQEIVMEDDCFVIYSENNRLLDSSFSTIDQGWKSIQLSEAFIYTSHPTEQTLFVKPTYHEYAYDSVSLWGNSFAAGHSRGNRYIHFSSDSTLLLDPNASLKLVKGATIELLASRSDKSITLIHPSGRVIMSGEFNAVKILGDEYIVVDTGGGEELFTLDGDQVLSGSYEAFGGYEEGGVSLLENGKLGYFHEKDSIFLRPNFSKRVKNLGNGYLAGADLQGFYIMDNTGERVDESYYENILRWNDSTVFVKKNNELFILNPADPIPESEFYTDVNFTAFENGFVLVRNKSGLYGLIHPNQGVVIPTGYTFIEYFGGHWRAERYFKEADYYLLAYYNPLGKLVYRTGLTPEEYELLICED